MQFAANKKWAMSPLLSPPAGVHTDKTLSDKFVCTARIPRIAGKFNGCRDFEGWVTRGGQELDSDRISSAQGSRSPVTRSTVKPASRSLREIFDTRCGRLRFQVSKPDIKAGPSSARRDFSRRVCGGTISRRARSLERAIASGETTYYSRLRETGYERSPVRGQSCIGFFGIALRGVDAGETITE